MAFFKNGGGNLRRKRSKQASAGVTPPWALKTSGRRKRQASKLSFETLEQRQLLTTFYVDGSSGNDANDGDSLVAAFATIQAGANAAQPGDTVLIRGGTYREAVNVPRSGSAVAPITFAAFPNEEVIVSGGELVTGWTQQSGDIWAANVNWDAAGNAAGNTLFVNGDLKFQAREYAENDPLEFDNWGKFRNLTSTTLQSEELKGYGDDFWNGAIIRHHQHDWVIRDSVIADYDSASGTVTFVDPIGAFSIKGDRGFYIYGTIDTLNEAGEWFKDSGTNTLYYQVEPGQNPNSLEIEFKQRDYIFDVDGRDYIYIEGLTFRGASIETDGNTDYNVYQGNTFYAYDNGNVGRLFMTGDNNVFRDNEVSQTWGSVVTVNGVGNQIVNNYLHDIGYFGTARVLAMDGAEHLVSHNTVIKFSRSFLDGFPARSEFAYNVFEQGGLISFDTGVFDSDGGGGNDSQSIFHHNVFRNNDSPGIYMAFYGRMNNSVIHHNVLYDYGSNRTFTSSGTDFRQGYHNTIIGDAPRGDINIGNSGVEVSYSNNLQISLDRMASLGIEVLGNHNYTPGDFVDFNGEDFRLAAGSGAIDTGIVIPGINDDYLGAAPDAGAFEFGAAMWEYGHNFTTPPTPVYDWKPLAGTNLFSNGLFAQSVQGWTNTGTPNPRDRNGWNLGLNALTGTFRTQSVEFTPGEGMSRVFTELKPNTEYTVGAVARQINQVTVADQISGTSGSIATGEYRDEKFVTGLSDGEWVRYDNIDFGDPGQFDQIEILYERPITSDPSIEATFQIRQGSPTGTVLGEFSNLTSFTSQVWLNSRVDLSPTSGVQSIYLVGSGADSAEIEIGSIRLLKSQVASDDLLTVNVTSDGGTNVTSKLGGSDWRLDYETLTFKTGPTATSAELSFVNGGRYDAYLDRLYVVERATSGANAAAGGVATQSSTLGANVAGLAIDGLGSGTSAITADQPDSWLQVDVGETIDLHGIRLTAPASLPADIIETTLLSTTQGNGSFESTNPHTAPITNTAGRRATSGADFVIPGWSVDRLAGYVGVDVANGNASSHGTRYAFANSGGEVRFTSDPVASHTTQLGDIFTVSLDVGSNTSLTNTYEVRLRFGNEVRTVATISDSSNVGTTGPTTYTVSYTATGADVGFNPAVEIFMDNSGGSQTYVDNVNLKVGVDAGIRPSNFRVSVWDANPATGGKEVWGRDYFQAGELASGETLLIKPTEMSSDGMTELQDVAGRFVRVQLLGQNNQGTGSLAVGELEVFDYDEIDVVNSDSQTEQGADYWQAAFAQQINVGELILTNVDDASYQELSNFTVKVYDRVPEEGGQVVWQKTFLPTGSVAPGESFIITGDEIADDGQTRLASVIARLVRVENAGTNAAGNQLLSLQQGVIHRVIDTPLRYNAARNGIASQSSNLYTTYGLAESGNSGLAFPQAVFTSTRPEANAWWQVDLLRTPVIDQIVLFNRQDAAERIGNFRVSVWDGDPESGGNELWGNNYSYANGDLPAGGSLVINGDATSGGVRLDEVTNGRVVRVQLFGSQILSLAEVQVWEQPATAPALPGDYNRDNVVDAADYTVWRDALGQAVALPYQGADGDGSGVVDSADLQVWRDNFGRVGQADLTTTLIDRATNNGSFETVNPHTAPITNANNRRASNSSAPFRVGQSSDAGPIALGAWEYTGSGFHGQDVPALGAQDGTYSMLANNNSRNVATSATFSQPVVGGDRFDFSFFTANNSTAGANHNYNVSLLLDGTTTLPLTSGNFEVGVDGTQNQWAQISVADVAVPQGESYSSVQLIVELDNTNTGAVVDQVYIDNLSLTHKSALPADGTLNSSLAATIEPASLVSPMIVADTSTTQAESSESLAGLFVGSADTQDRSFNSAALLSESEAPTAADQLRFDALLYETLDNGEHPQNELPTSSRTTDEESESGGNSLASLDTVFSELGKQG